MRTKRKFFLSIYFGFHDSNITIASDKEILLHLEAERVFRKKHMKVESSKEMETLIKHGLDFLNLDISDIDKVYVGKWNNKFKEKNGYIQLLSKKFKPNYTSHHFSHIGTAIPSGFSDFLVMCADGGSEDGVAKLYYYNKGKIEMIKNLDNEIATGRFYGTLTQIIVNPKCSQAHNFDAGKTMGLASLGKKSPEIRLLLKKHANNMNQLFFQGCDHLRKQFNISSDYDKIWQDKQRKDLAYTGQKFWIEEFIKIIKEYSNISNNLCMVGGTALNVVLNMEILKLGIFKNIYIPPVPNDSGQSIGMILYHHPNIQCQYPFLGRGYGKINKFPSKIIDDLMQGKIVAWYQGRSESGPRALGHRSFLGLPNSIKMRKKISEKVKKREPYRPVAPIVLEKELPKYFEPAFSSPYMLFSFKAKEITKKLSPAIVHADGSSRLQSLSKETNPFLYEVLKVIKEKTGAPILMNTSFNIQGEPIVDTPKDAQKTFLNSEAEILYIDGIRYTK